jgi:hypothetical protein
LVSRPHAQPRSAQPGHGRKLTKLMELLPLSAGLFGGQSARFLRVAEAYRELLKRHGRG